ncbi:MAGUK family member discs large 5 isoform X1 [Brevipalpus obovatus]|uniref:MAGUK family member discs large 5 isoform X1 n=1 Tax=Brevipalpus obovatus TaxID=246614 RepID=UPI003D9E54C1
MDSELQERYNSLLIKYDNCVRECGDLKQTLTRFQHQRDEYIKEMNQVITDRMKATKDLSRMTEERNSAIQEYNLIMSERDSVHKEIEKLQEELTENQKKITALNEEKKINMEQIDSLKREITTVLIDRDRLSKKVQDYITRYGEGGEDSNFSSPLRSPTHNHNHNHNHTNNNNHSHTHNHNQWDSSSSGISSSWKQNSSASIGSHRLDSMEQINIELEVIRRQKECLQNELMFSRNESEMLKKERTIALEEKDKIALERESMRTLCDRLRRERDRVVRDLAEALRESDDTRRQLREARKEIREFREKFENAKASNRSSLPLSSSKASSSPLSSPKHIDRSPNSPAPTLLDRAYNKFYGERKGSGSSCNRKEVADSSTEQEARETLASLDKVLADYSDRISSTKQAIKDGKKERDRDGGTWPKYRGPQVFRIPNGEGVGELNGGPTMRSINLKGQKSLAIFNPVNKFSNKSPHVRDLFGPAMSRRSITVDNHIHLPSSIKNSDKSDSSLYDKLSEGGDHISVHSSRNTPSNSSTPVPIHGHSSPSENLSQVSYSNKSESINHYANYSSLIKNDSSHRQRNKGDSSDYSNISAQLKDKSYESYRKSSSGAHSKQRPHSVHSVLTDNLDLNSSISVLASQLSTIPHHQHSHSHSYHPSSSIHGAYMNSSSKTSPIPTPPIRTTTDTLGLFRVAQPFNKRTTTLPLNNHNSHLSNAHHSSPREISSLSRQQRPPPPPPHLYSNSPQSGLHSYLSHNHNNLHMGSPTEHHIYDSLMRPGKTTSNNLSNSSSDRVNNLYQNSSEIKKHHQATSSSPFESNFMIGSLTKSPYQSSHYGHTSTSPYSHRAQQSMDANATGYKSDENDAELASIYDGRSTFPKRSQRIRIPSNPSVTSTCSSGKLSTGSIDRASSSALSDFGSPISFSVEWLSSGRRNKNSKNLKPRPGDLRYIEMIRSTGTLGINISSGPTGVFVTTVEKDSLACQAGIQIGDQILEICGINMRNAVYDHAANILRQCGERLNLLVQYNPNKLKIPGRFTHEEQEELENQDETSQKV